jgi:hypothetical protein
METQNGLEASMVLRNQEYRRRENNKETIQDRR